MLWCLAHGWVMCRLCFRGVFVLLCCLVYRFRGAGSLMFWRLAYAVVVSRSQPWCVYELCACVYIHLVHLALVLQHHVGPNV